MKILLKTAQAKKEESLKSQNQKLWLNLMPSQTSKRAMNLPKLIRQMLEENQQLIKTTRMRIMTRNKKFLREQRVNIWTMIET